MRWRENSGGWCTSHSLYHNRPSLTTVSNSIIYDYLQTRILDDLRVRTRGDAQHQHQRSSLQIPCSQSLELSSAETTKKPPSVTIPRYAPTAARASVGLWLRTPQPPRPHPRHHQPCRMWATRTPLAVVPTSHEFAATWYNP
jgi:hypothetical protein